MTTITLNIADNSIVPLLLDALKRFKGVEVCHRSESNSYSNQEWSREEGEMLVKETFLPAYKDVLKAEKEGAAFHDAHEIVDLLDD